jgi:hypothetical protein
MGQEIPATPRRVSLADWFSELALSVEEFLNSHPVLSIALFTMAYIPYVYARALCKPLWYDELATLAVAKLSSLGDIFLALLSGIEPNPPFLYVITHFSTRLQGNELITARIPGMFGFWLMCVCLYFFTARRGPSLAAMLALLFPFATDLFYYATEARPYGLLLGFSSVALLAWQSAATGKHREIWLPTLLLSLAATISCHYYAILIPVPFLCGEALRCLKRREIDWPQGAAIAGSYLVLVPLWPLLHTQTTRLGVHWAQPALATALDFYTSSLVPFLPSLIIMLLAVSAYRLFRAAPVPLPSALPLQELAAALAFALLPILTYIIGLVLTHTYTGRYSIAVLVGMTLLFWWITRSLLAPDLQSTLIIALILAASLALNEARTIRRTIHASLETLLQDVHPFPFDGGLPVVVQDPRDYLQMTHYASPRLTSRLYYLAEPSQALKYEGSVGLDISLRDLKRLLPLQVEDYNSFVRTHKQFLLFWGKPTFEGLIGWQLSKLKDDGARFQLVEQSKMRLLFRVELPPPMSTR